MDGLTDTKGKGVMMFAQRRQRVDAIAMEHEELRNKGMPVEGITEFEHAGAQRAYVQPIPQAKQDYAGSSPKQNKRIQDVNPVPKPLVPNRTAKPFLVFQESTTVLSPVVAAPVAKKHELKFKVPVPFNSSPQVWSPTGDIIASRDERISVPAIKTGILPESKRRSTKHSMQNQATDLYNKNQGDRRSYIEPEEDFFSLGAEACNFMQPRTVKLRVPPPVAPKPNLKPSCPGKTQTSPSLEPFKAQRSPVSSVSPTAVPHTQNASIQRDLAKAQHMPNPWAPLQSQAQTPANARAPVNLPSQPQLQPLMNSWSPKPVQSPVSIKAPGLLHTPSTLRSKPTNATNSVSSCPPSQRKPSPASPDSPPVQASDQAGSQAADGPTLKGKGAKLFAKRQFRMEKFVVDGETVQANRPIFPSPTASLPNSWRYSPNVRAPPPLSYNPLLAPFYPPAAAKQLPSTSPAIKAKTKSKPKVPKKHLSSLDVMKHQPYHLDSSLFKYDAITEAQSPSPNPSPDPISHVIPAPKPITLPYYSSYNGGDLADQGKSNAPTKSHGSVSCLEHNRSVEPLSLVKQQDEKLTIASATHHITSKQALSSQSLKTSSLKPSLGNSLEHFSPAALIARGTRQMAPRPKFSAKNPVVTNKQWKPIFKKH